MTDEQITEIFNLTKPFTYKAFARALLSAGHPAPLQGFAIKRVEGHGWIIDPPSGSIWIAHEGTPAGELMQAISAASADTHIDTADCEDCGTVGVSVSANCPRCGRLISTPSTDTQDERAALEYTNLVARMHAKLYTCNGPTVSVSIDDFRDVLEFIHVLQCAASPAAPSVDMQDERGAYDPEKRLNEHLRIDCAALCPNCGASVDPKCGCSLARAASTSANVAPAATVQAGEAVTASPAFALRGLYKPAMEYFIDGKPVTPDEYIAWQGGIIEAVMRATLPDPKYYGGSAEEGDQHEVKCAYVDGWNGCRASILATPHPAKTERALMQAEFDETLKAYGEVSAIPTRAVLYAKLSDAYGDALASPVLPRSGVWQ